MLGVEVLSNLTTSRKKKISFDEMIEHLDKKKIRFELIDKEQAKKILEESNYFYKITSYRKNFPKNSKGEYINLDFLLLSDLATIDMRLRYLVLQMCLDIEHSLKTKVLADITNDSDEDGYTIVEAFLNYDEKTLYDYMHPMNKKSHYNYGLYSKYHDDPPVWVLLEVITFGSFVKFIEFYYQYKDKPKHYKPLYETLKYAKNIRNSAAHNSPLLLDIVAINQLKKPVSRPISEFVGNIKTINKDLKRKRLSNRKIHDLTALLFIYDHYVISKGMKSARYSELKNLLERCKRNEVHYKKHNALISVYNYFNKIIDFLDTEM